MADRKYSADTELAVEPAVGDALVIRDVSDVTDGAGGTMKQFLWSTLKAIFAVSAKGVTNGDSHDHVGGDGAQIDHGGLGGLADDDHTQYVKHSLATAVSDFLVASGAGVFVKKTLAETKTVLGLGSAAYTASTDYVPHSLATAVSDFIVASGAGVFVKKTLAEVKTILSLAALAYKATVATADIDADAVTYARIQNVSATDKILGRSTAGSGDVEEIACTAAGRAVLDDADAAAQRATLSALGIAPRVTSEASNATPTPNADTTDLHILTAQAAAAAFAAPTGTPSQGQKLIIRIKDNATARALSWNAIYRALGVALPTTTTISKTLYVGFIYNSTDAKWDCIAKTEEA